MLKKLYFLNILAFYKMKRVNLFLNKALCFSNISFYWTIFIQHHNWFLYLLS